SIDLLFLDNQAPEVRSTRSRDLRRTWWPETCQDCGSADSVSPRPARITDQADYGPLHPARATRADLVSSRNLPADQADHSPLISPVCGSGGLRGARDLPGELTDMTGKYAGSTTGPFIASAPQDQVKNFGIGQNTGETLPNFRQNKEGKKGPLCPTFASVGHAQDLARIPKWKLGRVLSKMITVHCLLAVAASQHWFIHQLDVGNAFLHGDLHEEIYMSPLPGLQRQGRISCVASTNLSTDSNRLLDSVILAASFIQSKVDYSLFTSKDGKSFTALLICVDDILIIGNDIDAINSLKISRSKKGIYVSQRKYALEILKDYGFLGVRPIDFPMEEAKLSDKGELLTDPEKYRQLVGRLLYLTITRPDITYLIHILSPFMHQPRLPHMDATLLVVRYLKSTLGQSLLFQSNNKLDLIASNDSDWVGYPITRRSTTGYCVFLGNSLIS
ncbi:hypothetical protein Prudu_006651, partial [Prunus dulcis]